MSQRAPQRSAAQRVPQSWPLRMAVLLLLLEAAGLVGLSISSSSWLFWLESAANAEMPPQEMNTLFVTGMFGPTGVVALLAALGLFLRVQSGWLLAMLVQAIILAACLQLYLNGKPGFIFPLMVGAIVTVLYLNSSEVRMTFHTEPVARPAEDIDES